jgi:hypothetical protein
MMNAVALPRELERPAQTSEPSRSVFRYCFGRATVCVAWISLIGSIFIPPNGIGISICWMRGQFGIPCPGCGLTRSLSCAMRGRFYESWQFHPFGLVILAMFLLVALVSLSPEAQRSQLSDALERRARFVRALFVVFVSAFCSYGLLRALLQIIGVCQFSA